MKDEAHLGKIGTLNIPILITLIITLIVANTFIYKGVFAAHPAEADVFAAGKGEAMLVRMRSGAVILIDTGPDASILRSLGSALPPWRRSIDVVILTSSNAAQAGGLSSIQGRYSVGSVFRAGTASLPYGTTFTASDLSFTIAAPGGINLSVGSTTFMVSSSTPPGTYPL